MIKKIKSSLSEKILFIFLISLAVFTFGSFYLIKNKEAKFYVKVTQENGHQAWSSPIYIKRK